jgi:hypothetical protein
MMGFVEDNYETGGKTYIDPMTGQKVNVGGTAMNVGTVTGSSGFSMPTLANIGDFLTLDLFDFNKSQTPYKFTPLGAGASQADVARAQYNLAGQAYADKMNSFWGRNADTFSGIANVAQGLGSLANIYSGFKMLDMYEDQLDMAKQQWATTQQELARIKKVRDTLNSSYMS